MNREHPPISVPIPVPADARRRGPERQFITRRIVSPAGLLTSGNWNRAAKLVRLLASDRPHEVSAAVRALNRLDPGLHQLAALPGQYRDR